MSLGFGYGTCSTVEATAEKVAVLTSYALVKNGMVSVKFSYAVPANSTLNINSKGAKNIFYRGAKITAGVINAGDIATFVYDGTQYQLISVDANYARKTDLPAIDTALSATSTNPVQNKIINTALSGKANSSHTHSKSDITDFPASLPANGGDAATVNGYTVNANVPALGYYYVTCDSPLTTNVKTVTCEGFEFKEGARITVRFTAGNGDSPPSASVFILKINEDAGRHIAYNDWYGEGILTEIDSKKSEAFCSNQVWDFIFINGRFIMQAPLRGY